MNVLIGCECSAVVRDAFTQGGHFAMSCDLLESEKPGLHWRGDLLELLYTGFWDLLIAHPPCTFLARSGMRWLKDQPPLKSGKPVGAERRALVAESLEFFQKIWEAPIPQICVENPRSFLIPWPASQYIQPWQFGHGETKETGLWLKNLPLLTPTNIVEGRENKIHRMSPGPDRARERSRTYQGIANAMAQQWGTS
jgi:hypothetical protein